VQPNALFFHHLTYVFSVKDINVMFFLIFVSVFSLQGSSLALIIAHKQLGYHSPLGFLVVVIIPRFQKDIPKIIDLVLIGWV
jgi:hypothetical protein